MNKRYVFVSVSLIENLKQVLISVKKFHKLYDIYKYIIITTKDDYFEFKNALNDIDYVEVFDENEILNKKKFDKLCDEFIIRKDDYKKFRKSWYFQQLLKLTYILNNEFFPDKRIIIWDADTIPLKKIKFFKKNNPILYGSNYEYHIPYFECNNIIFGEKKIYPKLSFITQFAALNQEIRNGLREIILRYNQKMNISYDSYYVVKAVLNAISLKNELEPINGSHFSEYELIGKYMITQKKYSRKTQKSIKFFRNYVDGKLDIIQKVILYLFDYKHITYENENFLKKKQSYNKLFKALFFEITFFISKPLKKLFNKKK